MRKIITTLGPASASTEIINRMSKAGASSFRLNLSHLSKKSLNKYQDLFLSTSFYPSYDTQGAQLRLSSFDEKYEFSLGEQVLLISPSHCFEDFHGFSCLKVNLEEVFSQLIIGDVLRVGFGGLVLKITHLNSDSTCLCECISLGTCGTNKAADIIGRGVILPSLTEFDKYVLKSFVDSNTPEIFMSFVNSPQDISDCRALLPSNANAKIVAKIETIKGVRNLQAIMEYCDAILIDRGDLSREVSISRIPIIVNRILAICSGRKFPCYVATNVLESMIDMSLPTRAEISDIYSLLSKDVSGIVLAAEVAIGSHPVNSVRVVNHMIELFESESSGFLGGLPQFAFNSELPEPLKSWL